LKEALNMTDNKGIFNEAMQNVARQSQAAGFRRTAAKVFDLGAALSARGVDFTNTTYEK
jgi:hypothetical protein